MSDFLKLKLSDLANIVTGTTPSSAHTDSWGDSVPFITPADQLDQLRDSKPSRRLSEIAAKRLQKRIVPAGSTNLTCIGYSIGKVSMCREDSLTNQQINSLIPIAGVSDYRYLYYMIKNWSGVLRSHAAGSVTPIVNKSVLASYVFAVPAFAEQQLIGRVLGALDDKIAANSQLVTTIEALRRAKFHSMLAHEALEVPLSRTSQFVNGKAFTRNASGAGRVVIRIAELNSGLGNSTVYNDIEVPQQHLARPGDILFAWSGSLTLHRWFRDEGIINQHIFKVIPNDGFPHWLAYELVQHKLEEFKSIAADKATTMGHIQRKHLDEPVRVPSNATIDANNEAMGALWQRTLLAETENLKLAATRDTILPQLMSGKLRVRDAEAVLEKAGV